MLRSMFEVKVLYSSEYGGIGYIPQFNLFNYFQRLPQNCAVTYNSFHKTMHEHLMVPTKPFYCDVRMVWSKAREDYTFQAICFR